MLADKVCIALHLEVRKGLCMWGAIERINVLDQQLDFICSTLLIHLSALRCLFLAVEVLEVLQRVSEAFLL
jgi:hypothetical protein